MGVFIKICGLCCADDVEAVAALAPDAVGFVFWPKSARYVTPQQAADLGRGVPAEIRKVGVFVDASPGDVARVRRAAGSTMIRTVRR